MTIVIPNKQCYNCENFFNTLPNNESCPGCGPLFDYKKWVPTTKTVGIKYPGYCDGCKYFECDVFTEFPCNVCAMSAVREISRWEPKE